MHATLTLATLHTGHTPYAKQPWYNDADVAAAIHPANDNTFRWLVRTIDGHVLAEGHVARTTAGFDFARWMCNAALGHQEVHGYVCVLDDMVSMKFAQRASDVICRAGSRITRAQPGDLRAYFKKAAVEEQR